MTPSGAQPFVTPRALGLHEIPGIVEQYGRAAQNAREAGFDGVEIHAANGYLLDQFLRDKTNRRTDRYGGSIENRARMLLEVAEAVTAAWGGERVGVRLSPMNPFNDIADSDPAITFGHAIRTLDRFGLAYLHLVEPEPSAVAPGGARLDARHFRPMWRGPLIANRGYDRQRAADLIAEGAADLVAFGVLFLANPDLPERFRREAPLNTPDRATFYGGSEVGYTSYPFLDQNPATEERTY